MGVLGDFLEPEKLQGPLADGGLAVPQAKGLLLARAADSLRRAGVDPARTAMAYFVPGRIEVLGKHTDYAGGSSIVAAVEQGFCLVAAPRSDKQMRVCAVDMDERVEFALDPQLVARHGHWSNYPMTVARRISRNFAGCRRGLDLAFASDLPQAAGMSSSSALMVAVYLALEEANKLTESAEYGPLVEPLERAAYLGTVENGQSFGPLVGDKGVGTFGGSEDHTAILCSRPGHLGQFAYCPARFQRHLRLPEDRVFVVGFSGVVAEKTGAAQDLYNRAALKVGAIVEAWQKATGGQEVYLADILRQDGALPALEEVLDRVKDGPFGGEALRQRLAHFVAENEHILPAAGDALAAGQLEEFGRLVDRSQELTETLLENQVPATAGLARLAREAGATAASAFGAGFGGSVWALVDRDRADDFMAEWQRLYAADFPTEAARGRFLQTGAGPAALGIA